MASNRSNPGSMFMLMSGSIPRSVRNKDGPICSMARGAYDTTGLPKPPPPPKLDPAR